MSPQRRRRCHPRARDVMARAATIFKRHARVRLAYRRGRAPGGSTLTSAETSVKPKRASAEKHPARSALTTSVLVGDEHEAVDAAVRHEAVAGDLSLVVD